MQDFLTVEVKRFKSILLGSLVNEAALISNAFCLGSSPERQLLGIVFEPKLVSQILFMIILVAHSYEFFSRNPNITIEDNIAAFVDVLVVKLATILLASPLQKLVRTDKLLG